MGFASLYPSYKCMSENCSVASYLSLRAQRSNPESLRGKTLDCFAALAMTMGKRLAKHSGLVGWAKRSVPTTLRIVTGFVGTALRAFAHPTALRLVGRLRQRLRPTSRARNDEPTECPSLAVLVPRRGAAERSAVISR